MTKEEYQKYIAKESGNSWDNLNYGHVVIPSEEFPGWELANRDDNAHTDARIEYLETKVEKLIEIVRTLQNRSSVGKIQ